MEHAGNRAGCNACEKREIQAPPAGLEAKATRASTRGTTSPFCVPSFSFPPPPNPRSHGHRESHYSSKGPRRSLTHNLHRKQDATLRPPRLESSDARTPDEDAHRAQLWFPLVFSGTSFGFLWLPLVSYGVLWFPWFPLVFSGFLWSPIVSSTLRVSFGLL